MPEYTTATDVFRHAGIDSTVVSVVDIDAHIDEAEAWVDNHLQTTFTAGGRTRTEKREGNNEDFLNLERYGKNWIDADALLIVNTLTVNGTVVTPSTLFIYEDEGKIALGDDSEVSFFPFTKRQEIEVNYTYGHTAIPRIIQQITAVVAAISALAEQIGGTFDDVTSYQLPEFSASKGEPFTNIRETIVRLQNKLDRLMADVRPVAFMA